MYIIAGMLPNEMEAYFKFESSQLNQENMWENEYLM